MPSGTRQRLDKWLWFARIVKTRALAAGLIEAGHVRANRTKMTRPGHDITPGDVLTIVLHGRILVLKVVGLAPRRGAATSARLLYEAQAIPGTEEAAAQKRDATGTGTC